MGLSFGMQQSAGSFVKSVFQESFQEVFTENVAQDLFNLATGDALDYVKIDAANFLSDRGMTISAYFLTTLAEFGKEQIGETLADSANNAFVNAHFFSRTTVETQNEVATQESSPAISEDVGESPSATMPSILVKYNALIMNLQNVALQCRLKAQQWLACRSLNTKTQFVRALTIGSLARELQTGNVIARSDLRQFILPTDTFTSSFTAKYVRSQWSLRYVFPCGG